MNSHVTTTQRPVILIPLGLVRPHERHDRRHAADLRSRILAAGCFTHPICLDQRTMTLLDGHHRFRAAESLQFNYIPSVLVDYWDGGITVTAWRDGETVDRWHVLAAAASGVLMPIKTSRHSFKTPIGQCEVPLSQIRKAFPARRKQVALSDQWRALPKRSAANLDGSVARNFG